MIRLRKNLAALALTALLAVFVTACATDDGGPAEESPAGESPPPVEESPLEEAS